MTFRRCFACVVEAPADAVATSTTDIFGGGGAGRCGVLWLIAARGFLSGETVGFPALPMSAWVGLREAFSGAGFTEKE